MTTTPPDLSFLIPSKAKAWVALIGSGLSFVVPFILEATEGLSAPWPAIIGAVLWALTALGVYQAPYKPTGTVLYPANGIDHSNYAHARIEGDKPRNPWK